MSLNTKQLQARSRATYASQLPSPFAVSPIVPTLHPIYRPLPMRPTMGQAVRIALPMSPLGASLFVMFADALRPCPPSAFIGSYDRIEQAPSVGRNLNARA